MSNETLIQRDIDFCKNQCPDIFDEELVIQLKKALHQYYHTQNASLHVNTYLKDLGIPQIILFDILANRFPLVLTAQKIIQNAIVDKTSNQPEITIIDLGIGRGIQIMRILEALQLKSHKKITIIGIDIVKEAIEYTQSGIQEFAKRTDVQIDFYAIIKPIEKLYIDELSPLIPTNNMIIVNASLALHHLQEISDREKVFQMVKKLQPSLFSIIEPYADTFTANREKRMLNSYIHFTCLYDYISTLDLKNEEKKALKTFFYNDFSDTIIHSDNSRFEKYEPGPIWMQRGIQTGFHTVDTDCSKFILDHIEISKNDQLLELNDTTDGPHISANKFKSTNENFISFRYKNHDVLSVILFE